MAVELTEVGRDIICTPPKEVVNKVILFLACAFVFIPIIEFSFYNASWALVLSVGCNFAVYLMKKEGKK